VKRKDDRDRVIGFALSFPQAWEDHPWGETVAKVGKKVFVFAGEDQGGRYRISVKLTESHEHALALPDAEPTSHGLGKAGWVTIPIAGAAVGVLLDFIEESYRLVAPKRVVKDLDMSAARAGVDA
jgi:predicted DNA-binding protein (MmcQ/YjbR family)